MKNKIRLATPQDLQQILEIVNHNILYTTAVYDYEVRSFTDIESWFAEKQNANWPVIVAELDSKITGYGTYGTFRTKEAFKYTVEHSVYVAEGNTGIGIGKLLLAELITLARQQGFHTMIGCIDADNIGSIDFHKKFGFTDAGCIKQVGFKFNRWLDMQFMQLLLK